jgi:hypothetical protein
VFLSKPEGTPKSKRAAALKHRLHHDESPWGAFEASFRELGKRPEDLRDVLLTDGYLFADDPTVAWMLATHVTLGHLFREPEVVVARGNATYRAARKDDDYVWLDGPERDQPARLWLFDRVAPAGSALSEPRHVGVSGLARKLGTTEIRLERLTADGVVATLGYGNESVPAVLNVRGSELELGCEVQAARESSGVQAARARALREQRVNDALRAVIERQIQENLPFDEPKTEDGQQDGKLRVEWRRAYLRGELEYTFNEDTYSAARAAGVRRLRARQLGAHGGQLVVAPRRAKAAPRRAPRLRRARNREPPQRRTARRLRQAAPGLVRAAHRERHEYRPGDVVVILGPRDDDLLHYHSFFVVAADPVSGMPTWLAANAGRPRVRTWEAEMQNAPKRAIVARLRPRLEWLERLVGPVSP